MSAAALPTPPTQFVGRTADLDALGALIGRSGGARVVTVTGPAGVGKTRLAIETARRAAGSFGDGAVFVALAGVREAAAVPSAVLHALGVPDVGARRPLEMLLDLLADRETLLLLDNFEQVVDAASTVARIAADTQSSLLVTSRRPLGIEAERCFALAPMSLPPSPQGRAEDALRSDAVALFAARLADHDALQRLADDSVPVAVAICERLDGLPLALELAAARCRALSLPDVLQALEQRLPVLTRGRRDHPQRQQTMADAVRWSYDLLDTSAAAVFRRLGACIGGATLSTVEALAADLDIERGAVLDAVDDLVSHSLLQRVDSDGVARYRMLEVVREFAGGELARAGEEHAAQRRHALHLLGIAEDCAAALLGPEQAVVIDRLQLDSGNLTAAVRWAVDAGEAEVALRLCLALRMLWYVRGSLAEGRALFAAATAVPGAPRRLRARALVEASTLARHHGDLDAALALVRQGLPVARTTDDSDLLAAAQLQHGFVLHLLGRYDNARGALEESLALRESAGDALGVARALHHLGLVAYYGDGDVVLAWQWQQQCLSLFRELGNVRHVATALIAMVELARARGELRRSGELLAEALAIVDRLVDTPLLVYTLHHAAALAADRGHWNRAVRLLGAAAGLGRRSGAAPWPAVTAGGQRWLPQAERRLGARRVAALQAAGSRATHGEASALATAAEDDSGDPLTRRERDIAELVAHGLTNRAIAGRLFISERTVDGHVARILARLGFTSRAQIAAWVVDGARLGDSGA